VDRALAHVASRGLLARRALPAAVLGCDPDPAVANPGAASALLRALGPPCPLLHHAVSGASLRVTGGHRFASRALPAAVFWRNKDAPRAALPAATALLAAATPALPARNLAVDAAILVRVALALLIASAALLAAVDRNPRRPATTALRAALAGLRALGPLRPAGLSAVDGARSRVAGRLALLEPRAGLATVYRCDELAGLELRASATRLCALGGLRPLADNARQWLAALALQGHRVVLHGAGSKLLRLPHVVSALVGVEVPGELPALVHPAELFGLNPAHLRLLVIWDVRDLHLLGLLRGELLEVFGPSLLLLHRTLSKMPQQSQPHQEQKGTHV